MRDPTRGGLVNVLLDIAEASNVDLVVDKNSVPVRSEVRLGCEMLGIDPLLLVNEGKMVLTVDAEEAETVVPWLKNHWAFILVWWVQHILQKQPLHI